MSLRLRFTIFLIISVALHALLVVGIILVKPQTPALPLITPVTIVNLPQQEVKQLPPLREPPPKPLMPRESVSIPQPFDKSDVLRLPRTAPVPQQGAQQDKGIRSKAGEIPQHTIPDSGLKKSGPLPFLSQEDINQLALKGQTEDKFENDILSQETEAFKLLPYGRTLMATLNSNLRFPELAAVSGLQGDVYIVFEIKKDGSLGYIYVAKSSGYKILDDAAVRGIQEKAPFRPLPEDLNKDHIIVPVVGIFRIYQNYIR